MDRKPTARKNALRIAEGMARDFEQHEESRRSELTGTTAVVAALMGTYRVDPLPIRDDLLEHFDDKELAFFAAEAAQAKPAHKQGGRPVTWPHDRDWELVETIRALQSQGMAIDDAIEHAKPNYPGSAARELRHRYDAARKRFSGPGAWMDG